MRARPSSREKKRPVERNPAQPRAAKLWQIATLIAVASWPLTGWPRAQGIDGGWQVALGVALRERLAFGDEIVYTYGPLGWLPNPTLVWWPATALSLVFLMVVQIALARLLLELLRSWLPLLPASVLAWCALRLVVVGTVNVLPALIAGASIILLRRRLSVLLERHLASLLGAMVGASLLIKTDLAIAAALSAAAVIAHRAKTNTGASWRSLALLYLGSAAGTALLLAALLGTGPLDLLRFLVGTLDLAGGYTDAMALREPGREYEYVLAAGALSLTTVGACAGLRGADLMAFAGITGLPGLVAVKHAFVRHDAGNALGLFLWLAVVLAALTVVVRADTPHAYGRKRRLSSASIAVAAGLTSIAYLDAARVTFHDRFDPRLPVKALATQVADVLSPARTRSERARLKAEVLADAGLLPSQFQAKSTQTFDILPFDTALVWALDLDWAPAPVFQNYVAYTPAADKAGADHYKDDGRAADLILFRDLDNGLDGRPVQTESPRALLQILCNYQQSERLGTWDLLTRLTTSRCGPAEPLASITVGQGQSVAVPTAAPGYALTVRVKAGVSLRTRLANTLLRSAHARIRLDGVEHLLLRAVEDTPLLIGVAPEEAFAPISARPGNKSVSTIAATGFEGSITYTFEQMPIRPVQ